MTTSQLFKKLHALQCPLDKTTFLSYAEQYDSPEELFDALQKEGLFENTEDLYPLFFELWRRLLPEKKCYSIFVEELEHAIALFQDDVENSDEIIQDAVEELILVLGENVDAGMTPKEAFQTVSESISEDLVQFLYSYILDQRDSGQGAYFKELMEASAPYLSNNAWFELLEAYSLASVSEEKAKEFLGKLVAKALKVPDFDYYLELLSCLALLGDRELFAKLLKRAIPLIEYEGDFLDLLLITQDHFERLDMDEEESALSRLIEKWAKKNFDKKIDPEEADIQELLHIGSSTFTTQ